MHVTSIADPRPVLFQTCLPDRSTVCSLRHEFLPPTNGYLEKLSFRPNSALRAKILSSKYHLYACGKIFTRALILKENPNFARYPNVAIYMTCRSIPMLLSDSDIKAAYFRIADISLSIDRSFSIAARKAILIAPCNS